ncbi:MAG: beta-ketoacyl synthase [Candidatus Dactylopiibacterium carminicum]|nr:MAG: beta-ketoacyl synthase [Candidatus Dactylopiibacterium carminicum]
MQQEKSVPRRVAIIGSAYRFPSTCSARLWQDLLAGKDLVTKVASERWSKPSFLHPDKTHPGTAYTFAAGSIGDVSGFDAEFFGISPREAAQMDPQQRLLLEMAWEALESAGIPPSSLRGSRCGVFIGLASADYSYRYADDLAAIDASTATGNTASVAANRLSYFFDWHGPSMAIDTACSSSLVAFHQACRAIASGEVPYAITGGISLHLHPYGFIIFSKASMLSPNGRCNTFDADGDGYVRSEGGGLFLLKDYEQAIADGDHILAVVAHSAVNTDGRKSGLTVPNPDAQAALLRSAYTEAGIHPAEIDYLEAHGTGTAVGDPLETSALGVALGSQRPKDSPLPIGSVKSNLGHMETASGVAGLAKALHAIQYRMVPATIGIKTLNPKIRLDEWNLDVITENRPLKSEGRLVIGINSFGFGGANAHVILESHEAKCTPVRGDFRAAQPLVIQGRNEAALRANAAALAESLISGKHTLYDAAWHALFRREAFEQRAVVFAENATDAATRLQRFATEGREPGIYAGTTIPSVKGPAFIYSGNGSQWFGMGKALLEHPVFSEALRQIDQHFEPLAGFSLRSELSREVDIQRLDLTEIAQPCLFAIQVGITEMLRAQGVKPLAVGGHSVGEVAAAWACGALSLADAVHVIYQRSHLQGQTRGQGQMSAVGLNVDAAKELITHIGLRNICIAGINSGKGVTVAGQLDELARLEAQLHTQGCFYKRLPLDYAFHSPAMDGIEHDIHRLLGSLSPQSATTPFYSTVAGGLQEGEILGADYWWQNIRQPVAFAPAIQAMIADGFNEFIEIGPQPVLRSYLNDALKEADRSGRILPTGRRGDDSPARILSTCAEHMIAGGETDWSVHFPVAGNFVDFPTYCWQREAHWHPSTGESLDRLTQEPCHPLLGRELRQQPNQWESVLDAQLQPMLADHVVGDAVVFPGAAYAELALAVAREKFDHPWIEIEALEIRAPLLFGNGQSQRLRVTLEDTDGRLNIQAREYASDNDWALHACARLLAEPGARLLDEASWPGLPTRQPDFTRESHLELNRSLGLHYGPAFQAIARGWLEQSRALAFLEQPAAIAATQTEYLLHPGVLDSCFQLIAQLLREHTEQANGLAFIPTRIGRLALRQQAGAVRFSQVILRRHSPHSLLADFQLFDAEGKAVAVLEEVRFRAVRLFRSQTERIRQLQDILIAAPLPGMSLIDSEALAQAFQTCLPDVSPTQARYEEELSPLLDALYLSKVREILADCLAAHPEGLAQWHAQLARDEDPRQPAFENLLAAAQRANLLDARNQNLLAGEDETPTAEIWQLLLREYPDHFPLIHTISHLGQQLAAVLFGTQQSPLELPAGFSVASLSRHMLGREKLQQIAETLQQQIRQHLDRLQPGQRLRILELADDAPVFASRLCPELPLACGDYSFSSRQEAQATLTTELAEQHPALRFLPVTTDEPSSADRHDLVLFVLDGLEGDEVRRLLHFAHQQLTPGGSLLLITQQSDEWLRGNLGIAGLPLPEDPAALPETLQAAGFDAPRWLQQSPSCCLLLAVSQTASAPTSTPAHWLLLSEDENPEAAFSGTLAEALQARGDTVQISRDFTPAGLATALQSLPENNKGIVLLSGLAARAQTDVQMLGLACQQAAAVANACEAASCLQPLLLVTQGAMSDLLPVALRRTGTHIHPDSALWGFGRTLANEIGQPLRLIDLSCKEPMQAAAQLAATLQSDAQESELLIGPEGERFATRLSLPPGMPEETTGWKLGFSLPGQLRHLTWQPSTLPEPAADELEIRVEATGLNFRDVMYALGLLSDEALENGFAGATLGLEFAGTVLRCGNGVEGYVPGDRVVGFGSACFANKLVTRASTVAPVPAGISFEAAATIPTTFFTAYYALHHLARLEPGERVLIHGGAGGVGIAAIQIARWIGATVYATAGSDEKREFLRLLGADHVLDSRSLSYADDILQLTQGEGVDVVLNSLAGEAINRNFQILKPFGRFLELGKRDFYENTRVGLRPFRNNLTYFGIDADQLMRERPALTRRLFAEVMELFEQGIFHPLPWQSFEAGQVVDAFRHMQQARQIGKIVVTYRDGIRAMQTARIAKPTSGLQLAAQASYLVTGGLGGFGLRTAQWLVERGARHLILISRSGPQSQEAREAIAGFEAQGVTVLARACDVTQREALQALLAEARASLPPLRGVVHAAAVIEDALIRNLDAEKIARVLAPKVLGAEHLHQLGREQPLDFFVLYSSATTLFGNPGQAAYVAANSWLEALARHRRAQGLPATCLLWGAIDDAGFLARNEKIKEALQGRMGGTALRAALALDLLEIALLEGQSGQGILELDWHALSRFLPTATGSRYAELRRLFGEAGQGDDGGDDLRRLLAELSDEELHATVADMLRHELGEILRIQPEKIATDRPIQELGMDSLMGVELVIALEDRFGVKLPVLALSESPTIARLADRLIAQLREQEAGQGNPVESDLSSQVKQLAAIHAHETQTDTVAELTAQLEDNRNSERLINP